MLKNYLTIFQRAFSRQPAHAMLNLTCLSIGIAASLLILLYLDFELNYDRYHAHADRIYRIETQSIRTHEKIIDVGWTHTPANFGPYAKEDYPEIQAYVRCYEFWEGDDVNFWYGEKVLEEAQVLAVDATVFEVFSFDLVSGDPHTALRGPDKIVISESLARRIFGQEDPMGKILTSSLIHSSSGSKEEYTFMVTGVYRDMPKNSHLMAHAMISSETDTQLDDYYFNQFNVFTYVLLYPEVDAKNLASKLSEIYDKYLNAEHEPVLASANHEFVPLTKIHLEASGGLIYIYIFSAVGFLLLLIAGISYVNLATAQAGKRALEVGLRKVMGSERRQLIVQFLTESLFLSLLSLGAGIVIVILFIVPVNDMLGLQLDAGQLWQPQLLLGMLTIVLLLGILGGSYPAFFLSSFQPIVVMKNKSAAGKAPLRRMLLAVQLAVVIFVLVCTGMIYEQLQYLRKKDVGFDKEHIIRLTFSGKDELQKLAVLKHALLQSPYVLSVGAADFIPGTGNMTRGPVSADGAEDQEQKVIRRGSIDDDFLATMGIALVAGRNFSPDFPGDSAQSVIVNEAFVHAFGLQNPIGEKVRFGGKSNPNFVQIIGVVKDFHQSSLHSPIEPQIFRLRNTNYLAIKTGKDLRAGIHHIEKSWTEVFSNTPFVYRFLDDELQDSYITDQIRGKVFFSLSLLTIFISFLGLFGLASYLANQRIKEMGIRKVLGAGAGDMVLLMTKDFLLLVLIAALPAFVIAWYIVGQWLETFAFRTGMNYTLFGMALIFTLLLTFVTTGFHAFRTTCLNPAETLKYE